MNPSDENLRGTGLSEFSQRFARIRDDAIAFWKSSTETSHGVTRVRSDQLIDTFPIIFDDLVQALTPAYPRELATSGTNLAEAHGLERAMNSSYAASDLLDELQKFRSAIFSVAKSRNISFEFWQIEVIINSFDKLTVDSLSYFTQKTANDSDYFIATFTHDVKSPLENPNASAQLIRLQTNKNTVLKLVSQISYRLNEAGIMIENLLEAITQHKRRKTRLDITFFDIESLVVEAVNEARLNGSAVIYQTVPIEGFWCRASLKRALTNLLFNAQKYNPKNSSITVNVSRFEERLLISIHNFGQPISTDLIPYIFELPEHKLSSESAGLGAGLPLVKLVAESHGGVALVDSNEARGTTFSVNFPIDARPFNLEP